MANAPDPNKITVQLNLPITWQLKQDLMEIAEQRPQSLASLIRESIVEALSTDLLSIQDRRDRAAVLGARDETR
tara:strand:+ start:113 stop:334 length:222 start_codon:yes stop_codon:yes gene_type:complete